MRLLGSAAVIGLFGSLMGTAQAVETQFGDFSITFDTTISMGAAVRTGDRNNDLIAPGNGGPVDLRAGDPGSVTYAPLTVAAAPALCAPLCPFTGNFTTTVNPYAYPGSINSDDGRLNFDSGDLIGANVKANHDLVVKWRNYTVFARGVGFYDAVLNDRDVGQRSLLTDDAIGDVGRNYELLDLFVSADYTFGGMPLNIRVGKQVINWGESTFILGGNNIFNPIDVGAFRRPGSEIKEALLPVNAISGSVTLPEELLSISLAGYYGLDWEPFELDAAGTPFAGSDVATFGSGFGGNQNARSFLADGLRLGYKLNCGIGLAQTPTALPGAIIPLSILPNPATGNYATQVAGVNDSPGLTRPNCSQGAARYNYATNNGVLGFSEEARFQRMEQMIASGVSEREALMYEGIVERAPDELDHQDGDFGLSARYLADGGIFDGFEFAAYYQNYTSRLPFAGIIAGQPTIGLVTSSNSGNIATAVTPASIQSSLAGKYAGPAGCTNPAFGNQPGGVNGIGVLAGDARYAALDTTAISDPQNLLNVNTVAQAAGFLTSTGGAPVDASKFKSLNGPQGSQTLYYYMTHDVNGVAVASGSASAVVTNFGTPGFYHHGTGVSAANAPDWNNVRNLVEVNCALSLLQSTLVGGFPVVMNGSMFLGQFNDYSLSLSYPTDIDVFGASFAGTVLGWGVQGEMTYRPRAPFQEDTDSLTIAAATDQCAFLAAGLVGSLVYELLNTTGDKHCLANSGRGDTRYNGVIENEMFTAQIGATATFTSSEWFIDAIGADLGIFVPEIGAVYVPGVEDTWVDNNPLVPVPGTAGMYVGPTQYQNIGCQGTDLPLGSLLELDAKASKLCRPNDWSAGMVLLATVQYNNAFNSGFVLQPAVAFSWDFVGSTPAPYGNYLEGRMALNLGVTGTLNNNLKLGVNYTNYFGAGIANKAQDLDFASASVSYSF